MNVTIAIRPAEGPETHRRTYPRPAKGSRAHLRAYRNYLIEQWGIPASTLRRWMRHSNIKK